LTDIKLYPLTGLIIAVEFSPYRATAIMPHRNKPAKNERGNQ
jgi:hypothetical protein